MADLETLRPGSRGTAVELLQLGLQRAGFSPGEIDGIFGTRTANSLSQFQSNNALIPDAIAGPLTWSALTPWLTGYISHTVRSNDTLYNLARRYSTTVKAIDAANPGISSLQLRPGSVLTIPLAFNVVPTNISFTPTVLDYCIHGLSARYPFLKTGSAGKSIMGRNLHTLSIGTGKNQVFYNAAHHANEWITSVILMKFLEDYARAYAFSGTIFGTSARDLYEITTLFIMPMVNPDGVSLVTGELRSGPSYRYATEIAAAYQAIPFPSGWKANIEGIDPNLQYPAGWSEAREIKFAQGFVSPAPRDYVGAAPLEIPESRAAYNFTRQHDFSITLSYHTQGRVIYWRHLDYMPARSRDIALQFSAVSGYVAETTPTESGYAGYKDWFIQDYNRPGYTIEAGTGVSPLPLSQFDEIYRDNLGILTLGLSVTA